MTPDEYYLDALGVLTQDWPAIKAKFDAMEAEIERLRELLDKIAKHPDATELIKQYAQGRIKPAEGE